MRPTESVVIPPGTNVAWGQWAIPMEVIEGALDIDRDGRVLSGSVRVAYPPTDATIPTMLRTGEVTFSAELTDEGRAFFDSLMDDAWLRLWYRDPGAAWWER